MGVLRRTIKQCRSKNLFIGRSFTERKKVRVIFWGLWLALGKGVVVSVTAPGKRGIIVSMACLGGE